MRGTTLPPLSCLILTSAMLLVQGCVIQLPSMRAVPVTEAVPTQVSSNQVTRHPGGEQSEESSPNIVCVDPQGNQCMVCDSAGGNCHFPVFKLP
jgi:hypothetical protein